MKKNKPGKQKSFAVGAEGIDSRNDRGLHLFVRVYGSGTVRVRGLVRKSFDQRKKGRSVGLKVRALNPDTWRDGTGA